MLKKIALPALLALLAAGIFFIVWDKSRGGVARLPTKRPVDIVINAGLSTGGMMPTGKGFQILTRIAGDQSSLTFIGGDTPNTTNFKVTSQELDDLYRVFMNNEFNEITLNNEVTHDAGSSVVSVSWGNYTIRKGTDGTGTIAPQWQKKFDAILFAINELATKKTNQEKNDMLTR